jgi:hypothetical protein
MRTEAEEVEMEHKSEKENEGMSTRKKVVTGAAIGVAVPAAVGVAKKLLGNGDEEPEGTKRSSNSSGGSRGSSGDSGNRTKEQLYKQAKRLNIEGRSNMTKEQLARAISRARS